MSKIKKLVFGATILFTTVILGSNVHAEEFTSRILTNATNTTLGRNLHQVYTPPSSYSGGGSLPGQGSTVNMSYSDLAKSSNSYCIQSSTSIPTDRKVTYKVTGSGSFTDNEMAYLLAGGSGNNGDGKHIYNDATQQAIWNSIENGTSFTGGGTSGGVVTGPGGEYADYSSQYATATAFQEFKNGYGNPYVDESMTQTFSNHMSGPYKIIYSTSGGFGSITSATLTDQDGKVISTSNYSFVNRDGTALGRYPAPGQEFYLKINNTTGIRKARLKVYFDDASVSSSYVVLEGTYKKEATPAGTYLCTSCQEKLLDAQKGCGGSIWSTKQEKHSCGVKYVDTYYANGSTQESRTPISSEYIYTEIKGSNKTRTRISCGSDYIVHIYAWRGTQWVEVAQTKGRVYCTHYHKVTVRTESICSSGSLCSACQAKVNAAKNGCGSTIEKNYYDKTGGFHERDYVCGQYHDGTPANDSQASQKIIMATSSYTTGSSLEFDIILASVDLSLRKFVTAVNDTAITNRVPQPDVTSLKNETETTSNYNHTKNAVSVGVGDLVTYTIRVYNEGQLDGYAGEIKDYLPSNLEFISGTVDGVDYKWNTGTVNGRTVITTDYLKDTKLEKFTTYTDSGNVYRSELDYKDVKLICRVKSTALYNEKLVNIAEITKYSYIEDGTGARIDVLEDADSKPNDINLPTVADLPNYNGNGTVGSYVKGQEDDDDFEAVITDQYIDLSLRKFISGVNYGPVIKVVDDADVEINRTPQIDYTPLTSSGTTANYNHTKEAVEIGADDLITYTIRVYNEGSDEGYAREIKDYLPAKLKFYSGTVDGVDYGWQVATVNGRQVVTTTYLKDRKLARYKNGNELDYAEVKLICQVADATTVKLNDVLVNIAEISKYAADANGSPFEVPYDRDSNPNNISLPSDANFSDYNGKAGNPTSGNGYWQGQQDDDDFDKLIVRLTDISGTAWLDGPEGKQEERDGILTNKDRRFAGIRVELWTRQADGSYIIAQYRDKDGNLHDDITTTDENGWYLFKNKSMVRTYIVRFEYFGQEYIPVAVTELNSGNYSAEKSAGKEVINQNDINVIFRNEQVVTRSALNDKFHEVINGMAKNGSGNNTVSLRYNKDSSKYTSTLIRDDAFNNETKIKANTVPFHGTEPYTKYINLGLMERAQINLGLMTDVKQVDLYINGKTTTYDYSQRDEGTAIDINAKVADINRVYNQAIYKSDYNYRISDYTLPGTTAKPAQSNELEAYITYKIKVKNYSSVSGKVSELKTYYDSTYELVDSWYSKQVNGNDGKVTWVSGTDTNGYKTMTTSSVKDINIAANEEVYVFIRFHLLKDNQGFIRTGEKYIISEITAYTTDNGLIDINSEPNNVSVRNWDEYVKTYEDDTDRAPGLNIYVDNSLIRTMTGFVWEDLVSGKDADGVNIGNGIKDGSEQNKDGIIVQLIELVDLKDGNAPYEYIWQEMMTGSDKVSFMDSDGKLHEGAASRNVNKATGTYTFTEYVPGNYFVRFRYGETEETIALNGQDYKSTAYVKWSENGEGSSAKDNKDRRLAVMNYSIDQTNAKAEILARTNNSLHEELLKNTWMYADTVESMVIGIRDNNPGHSVNFGLLKRPESKLVMHKEVTGVKISNKGIVYVDTANGINTGYNATKGTIELDDELINGGTIEVKYDVWVENTGENDTLYNYFEGLEKYGNNQHKLITTRATAIYDYPDKIGFDASEGWSKDGVNVDILSDGAKRAVQSGELVIKVTDNKLFKALKPTESTEKLEITLSKIMAIGADDDLMYVNRAEIVGRSNEVGRRDEQSTPGNYIPRNNDQETNTSSEGDTDEAEIMITPPEGQVRTYYEVWIGAIALLAIGIVLIKKFVANKNK